MAITLKSNALLTLPEIRTALGIPDEDRKQDDLLAQMVNAASDLAETYTSRRLKFQTYTGIRYNGPGGNLLIAVEWPIYVVTLLEVDKTVVTVWMPGDTGEPGDSGAYVVDGSDPKRARYAIYKWFPFTKGTANVKLTYKAGYGDLAVPGNAFPVPDDLKQGVIFACADWYNKRDKNRWGVAARTVEGQTVSFTQQDLPKESKALWAGYRRALPFGGG